MGPVRRSKPVIFTLCLLPLVWLVWSLADGGAGPNPQEYTNRFLGDWALRFLLLSLALRPLRDWTKMGYLLSYRRMIGLYAFFYASLHVAAYLGLDLFFDFSALWADLVKRSYITVGMVTFLMLCPLAATSTNKMIRRLKKKRWKALHRLVYPASIGAVIHHLMMTRTDLTEPLIYAGLLAVLLGWRAVPLVRDSLVSPPGSGGGVGSRLEMAHDHVAHGDNTHRSSRVVDHQSPR